MKLQSKLMLSFVFVGVVSVAVTGWLSFENARSAIEQLSFDRLISIRETKKRQVESYFAQMRNQIISSASDRMIVEAAQRWRSQRAEVGRLASGRGANGNLPGAFLRRSADPAYGFLEDFRVRFGYEDIIIVDAADASVLFSLRDSTREHIPPEDPASGGDNLFRAFKLVTANPGMHEAALVDFSVPPGSRRAPASFLAAPVYAGDVMIAVLLFQVSIDHINVLMTSGRNWKAEGLGETGETYIVGDDFRMRNDSRFFIQERERYFHLLHKRSGDSSLVRDMRSWSTSILLQEVRTASVVEALKGHAGTRLVDDYRGVRVISAFAPLHIEGVRWVMIAEIDVREAFASVYALREQLILSGLVIVLIGSALSVLMSRMISRPVNRLARSTERFGTGDFSQRVEAASSDEIGMLGRSFNVMADGIARQTALLHNEIGERRRAEDALRESRERLRQLSAHLQTAREKERKGIAREIHDELGQALTAMKLDLSLIRDEYAAEGHPARQRIETLMHTIDATIKSVQRIITDLRPRLLDDLGLTAAIEWQAQDFQRRTGIACFVSIHPEEFPLDPDRSIAIFRIFQETLTNAARHARATSVRIRLEHLDEAIELEVCDNGRGIAVDEAASASSFGIIGIRERAESWGGRLAIEGTPGSGTRVLVHIPSHRQENA